MNKVFPLIFLLLSACAGNSSENSPFSLVSSTCSLPDTKLELKEGFLILTQNGESFLAPTKITNGLTHGYSIEVGQFNGGSPTWEKQYFVSHNGNVATFESKSCINTFRN